MKLHRVSLQGFLAHYGREVDGAIVPIELDFRESNLWLMHGANGSGKSSVFDAITFALFDKARGSQLAQLVNDRSMAAHVEVEMETGGERYLIKRRLKLKKNRDGHQSSWAEVSRWDAGENRWAVEENIGKIDKWAERTLKVSYQNFVSSVILEQGRADRFLSAKPTERRKQLKALLDLSVYDRISETANARRNQSRVELKVKETQLQNCAPISPEDLAGAETAATNAQTRLDQSSKAAARAQKLCDDAHLIADWQAQVATKIARQSEDAAILADAEIIENAVAERDGLNAVLPSLRSISAARRALSDAESELKSARVELENVQTKARELTPLVEQTRAQSERAESALTQAQLRAKQAELDGARAQADAETLGQIEELEADVATCERDLEPYRVWLNQAESIESRRAQIEQLNEIIGQVRPISQAAQKLAGAQKAANDASAAHETASQNAKNAETDWKNVRQAHSEFDGADEELKTRRANLAAKLELNREILRARDELEHAEECPTCGSSLDGFDGSDARERIETEREILRREIERWQAHLGEIEGELRAWETDKNARAQAEKSARAEFEEADKIAGKAEALLEALQRDVAEKNRELATARENAGDWADEDLAALEEQLARLEPQTIKDDWRSLQNARGFESQSEATAKANRVQLRRLPTWDDEKRRSIGELQGDLQSVLQRANERLKAADDEAQEARERQQKARDDVAEASNAAKIAAALETQKLGVAQKANADLGAQWDKLSPRWREHAAAHDDEKLEDLNARYDELGAVAARGGELAQARQRVRDLESEIKFLQQQIAAIPAEHRVEVEQAQTALNQARANGADAEVELQNARENLFETRQARATLERCEAERNEAEVEANRDKDLAEALGRDGLQARIIKQAQENLRSAANGILGRLSKGHWQIDLREGGDDDNKELEIIARDGAHGNAERTFDALSGGERFRVAISLAIAIGQMAAGGAPMNTLVIDEGFGALDEENRGLMVDNLRHLSEHELKNGRIIVVSHQNDVQESFGHRYELSRDPGGYAQVEMTVG